MSLSRSCASRLLNVGAKRFVAMGMSVMATLWVEGEFREKRNQSHRYPRGWTCMCGIAGIIDLRGRREPDRAVVERMTQVIVHRGPDEGGFLFAPGVAAG